MTTPRHRLVSTTQPMFYHLVSRCVRRSWLCGRHNGKDFSHRKDWLIQRMRHLAEAFSLEVHAYAVMSNHFHLVVYYDPRAASEWSDEEVVERWLHACPPKLLNGEIDLEHTELLRQIMLNDPARLRQIRKRLSSLSTFMQFLKQPIARRANLEDGCTGHFFEQRFYSGALLDEKAIVAAMAYVDLNPIRAKIADTLETSEFTSIAERLRSGDLTAPMTPLVSGLVRSSFHFKMVIGDYLERLQQLILPTDPTDLWQRDVALIKHRQRAFGSQAHLEDWTRQRGMQLREAPLA